MAKDGILVIEVPYLAELIDNLEFDTIYHEHLSYFSLRPVARLCEARGFRLVDVEPVALHGGSVVMHICRADAPRRPSEALAAMLREEDGGGRNAPAAWEAFAGRVRAWKTAFEAFVDGLRRGGARLIGYGAAAKANTLLNYCPAVAGMLGTILDRSPLKHEHLVVQ